MALSLQTLNDAVLDEILRHVFNDAKHMRLAFLSSMGSHVSHAAMRMLYTEIAVEDDMRYYTTWATSPRHLGPLAVLLNNPMRYGTFVRRLIVREPTQFDEFEPLEKVERRSGSSLLQFDDVTEEEEDDIESQGAIRPLEWEKIHELLSWCPSLTDLVWRSSTPPPDGLCESLALYNSNLTLFAFVPETPLKPESPQTPVHARYVPPRWDAPSLPLLTQLPVRTLHLSRLSQTGSRALGQLCVALGDHSLLEDVMLDFLWLDDTLCEKLSAAAKKVKRLRLSTSGAKLTDRGLNAVLDAAMDLEDFDLTEVEGRLSKTMWQTAEIPVSVTKFAIRLSENGPHHSWVADHLGSLQSLSFQHMTVINICRTMHPFDSSFDDVATLQPIADELVTALRQARGLESLECDWWSWRQEHLKPILESCVRLQVLRIAFDGPISKLLSLTSIFAPAPLLRQLYVYISRAVVPLRSPTVRGLLTPSASPTVASSATLPSVNSSTPPDASEDTGDMHTPPLREVKKFVRRCQALTLLDWYGWNGRGSWTVSRPRGVTKSTLNVTVEYAPPPAPSEALCTRRALEDTAALAGWVAGATEREGASWTGDLADMYAAQRQAEELATPARTKMSRKMSAASTAKEPETATGADPFVSTTSASTSPVSTSFANGPPPLPPLKLGRTVTGNNHEPLSPTSPKRERRPRTRRGTDASDGHSKENGVTYNGYSHRGGAGGSNGGGGTGGSHWQRGQGDGTHKRNGGRANVMSGSQQQEARTAEDRRPRGTRGKTTRTASG